jgi:centrosomal CEP192-like protein
MSWIARFTSLTPKRPRVAFALTLMAALIAGAACADRVATGPQREATPHASLDINPSVDDLWVSPNRTVVAGDVVTGTITLAQPEPNGARISLVSSNPQVASVDSIIYIPAGGSSQTFLVRTYPTGVDYGIGVNLVATWTRQITGAFTVVPAPPPPPPATPSISVTPGNLTFGPQAPGTTSAPQIVTVRNTGTVNLALYPLAIGMNGPFRQTNNCPNTLVPDNFCTILVVYAPTTSAGAQSGSMTVPSSAPSSPNVVTLNGTPTPWISVTPTAIGWGSVALGTATSGRVVKITSTGTAPLFVSSLTLGGANPGDFTIDSDGCTNHTLNPGTSCAAYVSFEPLRIGTRTATITIAHNASVAPVVVSLSGTGVKGTGGYIP